MRRGFTLIELIITIVIMAGVFMVIPKILIATGKSDRFSTRQDALMQAVSLTQMASRMAWDENNTAYTDILQTDSGVFECNTTLKYRIGSYLSANGRMCTQPITATLPLGAESGESDYTMYDDIDDYAGSEINITYKGSPKYRLTNRVVYLNDAIVTQNGNDLTIDLSAATPSTTSTAIKRFSTKVRYVGKRGKARNITSFYYYSTNIGQITLAARNW
jgi:prepilin-type N-terminal cleavage/methylation domain-containing protein